MTSSIVLQNQFQSVVDKTKRLLLKGESSVNGLRSLSRSFNIADDCGGSTISEAAFTAALAENGVKLSPQETKTVLTLLDRGGTGEVDPAEFMAALRHTPPLRATWVSRAWAVFDKDSQGSVSVEQLQGNFRADRHPDVIKGARAAAEVAEEFNATFNNTTNPDGSVSRQEFEQYYAGVSAATPNDEAFEALVRGVWPIPGVSDDFTRSLATGERTVNKTFTAALTAADKKDVTESRNRAMRLQQTVTQQHRPAVMASALVARRVSAALRAADTDETGFLSTGDFCDAIARQRLYFADESVLEALDTNGDGTVDYYYYLLLLLPPLPDARRMMVERLWAQVFRKRDNKDRVEVMELHRRFEAKDGEEKSFFLSSWDVREAVRGKVRVEELLEWYVPQSSKVQLDKDFEALLRRQWKGFGSEASA